MSTGLARARTIITAALCTLCAGCISPPSYLYLEDFEGPYCDGSPCGWTQVAGRPGSARIEEILAGEHALVMEGDGVLVRAEPAISLSNRSDLTLALDLIARCDVSSTLSVEIGATAWPEGTLTSYEPRLTPNNVLTDWSQGRPRAVIFPAQDKQLASLDSIIIVKSGSGICEIASIGILNQFF